MSKHFTEAEAVQIFRQIYGNAVIGDVTKMHALLNLAATRAVAEVAKDAERYRAAKDNKEIVTMWKPSAWDKKLDAAIEAEKGAKE